MRHQTRRLFLGTAALGLSTGCARIIAGDLLGYAPNQIPNCTDNSDDRFSFASIPLNPDGTWQDPEGKNRGRPLPINYPSFMTCNNLQRRFRSGFELANFVIENVINYKNSDQIRKSYRLFFKNEKYFRLRYCNTNNFSFSMQTGKINVGIKSSGTDRIGVWTRDGKANISVGIDLSVASIRDVPYRIEPG